MHSTSGPSSHTASRLYSTVKMNIICKLQMSLRLKYDRATFNVVRCILSTTIIRSRSSFHCVSLYLSSFRDNISPFLFFSVLPLYMSISFIYTPSSHHYIVFPESWTGKARYRHLCLRHSRFMFHLILTPLHQFADTMLSFFNLSPAILPIQFANRSSIKVL